MSLLTRWHFEGRHDRNRTPEVDGTALQQDPSWRLLDLKDSRYHQDPDKEIELKFVKADEDSFLGLGGFEAVWDPNESRWLEAGAYGSTYNYVRPGGVFRGFGHFVFDVVPYWFLGTDRGVKHKSFFERVTGIHRG